MYHFRIAQRIPVGESRSFFNLAAGIGIGEVQIAQLLRLAMTNRILCEPKEGYVAHTAASPLLAEDPNFFDWIGYTCEDGFPSAAKEIDALEEVS